MEGSRPWSMTTDICTFHRAIAGPTSFSARGPSRSTRGWDPPRFTMSMRHLARSPRTRRSAISPEGTVLIKEVYEASTGPMTTGTVSHAQTLKGLFVMVKDSKNSHPGNMLWGDGWGWSWFDAASPTKTTSTNYKQDCVTCHVPARETDWVYTSGYPTLK